MIRRLLLVLALAPCLAACDQDARVGNPNDAGVAPDGSGGSEPRTLGEFVERFASTYCARIEACCGGLPSDFPSREWCVTSVTAGLGEAANTELGPEHRATSVACLQAVEGMGCMERNDSRSVFDLFLTPEAETACLAAPLGRRGCAGSVCDGECIDDVCIPPVPTGDTCCAAGTSGTFCSNSLCQDLDYCDIDGDDLCHAREPIGSACADGGECLSFLCSTTTSRCEPATLESWICR